jgi:DNA-binding NarL/FixJ family response regulator
MAIRLVLADDHPLILSGLTTLFQFEPDLEVLASCADGARALEEVRLRRPDVAVLDIRMPGVSGINVARKIIEEKLPTRVVLLTAALEDQELLDVVLLGIQGVVLKEMAPQFLVQCIRKVHSGEQWLERRSAKNALDKLLKREAGAKEVATLLTAREIELVKMVAVGLRNKEIAQRLFITEGTVKVHLHNIYQKVDVEGRMGLLRYAQEKGLA